MPRRPRVFMAGQPIHLIQWGHNRSQVFFGPEDATTYLNRLGNASQRHDLAVHAYVLMPNHIHLLVSPPTSDALPKAMRDINWHYTRHVNAAHGRSGSLWEGRYKACVVDAADYLLICSRYIETNPVRSGIAPESGQYRWSSYKANALGAESSLLTPHRIYLELGATQVERASAYTRLFDVPLAEGTQSAIRKATHGGWALGSSAFEQRAAKEAGCNMTPRGRGRPWPKKDIKAAAPA